MAKQNFKNDRIRQFAYRVGFGGVALAILSAILSFCGLKSIGSVLFWAGFGFIFVGMLLGVFDAFEKKTIPTHHSPVKSFHRCRKRCGSTDLRSLARPRLAADHVAGLNQSERDYGQHV